MHMHTMFSRLSPARKRWLDDHPARDACDAGRCDEFHRHFALPSARGKAYRERCSAPHVQAREGLLERIILL